MIVTSSRLYYVMLNDMTTASFLNLYQSKIMLNYAVTTAVEQPAFIQMYL